MFLPTNPSNLPPFEYAYQHIGLVSWPAICVLIWRVTRYVDRVTAIAEKTINQIDTLATNHMPHVQDGILDLVQLGKENNTKLDILTDVLKG